MQSLGVNTTEDDDNSNDKSNDPVETKTNDNDEGDGKTDDPSRTQQNTGSGHGFNTDDINIIITQFSAKTFIPHDTAQK